MKSRTSFFNRTALRKDISRFAPLWALYTVFTLMVLFLLWSGDTDPALFANNASTIMQSMGIVNFIYAGLCAIVLFGDLFAPRLCNALHAMPLRREGWFLTHCTAGFLFCIVPNILAALICALLLQQYFWLAFVWLGLMVLQFLFFFGVGVFAAVSAGNRLGSIAIYGIINFLAVIVAWLYMTFYEPFLYGIELELENYTMYSPVVNFTGSEFVSTVYSKIAPHLVFKGFVAEDWRFAYIAAAVGAVFLLLGLLVYRCRKLENAGDFISLQLMRPVFLIVYTLCVGAAMYFICDLMVESARYVFLILGLAIGFFTGQMLLERKVNIFRGKVFLGFTVFLAVFGATVGLTWLDPMGRTRYVPDTAQVESVSISPYASYYYRINGACELTEQEDIQAITGMHRDLVTNRSTVKQNMSVYIRYTLKNGTQIERKYYVNPNSDNGQLLRKYYSSFNYVLGGYDLDTLLKYSYTMKFYSNRTDLPNLAVGTTDYLLDQEVFAEKYGTDTKTYLTSELEEGATGIDVAMVRGLFEAIKADCEAGSMAQFWEYQSNHDSVGFLHLQFYIPRSNETISNLDQIRELVITVYDNCENTIAYLQSLN